MPSIAVESSSILASPLSDPALRNSLKSHHRRSLSSLLPQARRLSRTFFDSTNNLNHRRHSSSTSSTSRLSISSPIPITSASDPTHQITIASKSIAPQRSTARVSDIRSSITSASSSSSSSPSASPFSSSASHSRSCSSSPDTAYSPEPSGQELRMGKRLVLPTFLASRRSLVRDELNVVNDKFKLVDSRRHTVATETFNHQAAKSIPRRPNRIPRKPVPTLHIVESTGQVDFAPESAMIDSVSDDASASFDSNQGLEITLPTLSSERKRFAMHGWHSMSSQIEQDQQTANDLWSVSCPEPRWGIRQSPSSMPALSEAGSSSRNSSFSSETSDTSFAPSLPAEVPRRRSRSRPSSTGSFNTSRGISIVASTPLKHPSSSSRRQSTSFELPELELPHLPTLFPDVGGRPFSFADICEPSSDCFSPATSVHVEETLPLESSSSSESKEAEPIEAPPRAHARATPAHSPRPKTIRVSCYDRVFYLEPADESKPSSCRTSPTISESGSGHWQHHVVHVEEQPDPVEDVVLEIKLPTSRSPVLV